MQHTDADRTLAPERYLLGEMSSTEIEEFEEHLFLCQECAEAVKTGATFADNARAVFKDEAAVAAFQLQPAKERKRTVTPWWQRLTFPVLAPTFAALMLLCGAGYQRLVVISQLQRQLAQATAPQALPAFALHSVSRGSAPVIQVSANAGSFSLYFDVATESTSGYSCEVRDASGATRSSIQVPQPKPGEFVYLLLDRSKLPAGDYNLVVSTEGPDSKEVGQYPFKLEYQ
ncbi:MAG TPA: hypothetical protein VI455_13240 [Terriglobia bacterium]